MPPAPHWGFGPFRLDTATACLWREDQMVPLSPKPFAVLAYLVTHAGQVVTKDDLLEAVWPETAISEGVLKTCIGRIRQALGETARGSHYIATVHRRGYRFLAPVSAMAPSPPAAETAPLVPTGMLVPEPQILPPGHLVARNTEFAQLQQCWNQACQGVRQVVFVTGEAGIGKTTLVEAFIAQVSAAAVVWLGHGQCIEQYGAGEAYLPLLTALGQVGRSPDSASVIALLRQRAPGWLVQLPALLSPPEYEALHQHSSGMTRDRMLRELAEAVEALSAVRPLVLVLEDLHWSDYATLDWLAHVARRQAPARLLILGTYRPAEAVMRAHPIRTVTQDLQRHRCCTELILPYLSEAGVAAYLVQRFGTARWPEGLVRLLHQRTSGNPLFLVTVVEELVRQEMLVPQTAGWTLGKGLEAVTMGVPESLVRLIDSQLARLAPAEQELVTAASVAGGEFTAAALAASLELAIEDVAARCDALAHGGQFLRAHGSTAWPDGTVTTRYRFLHELYHEVVYARVSVSRRVRWHRQIGTRLEAGYGTRAREMAAELAVHFVRGQEALKAVYYVRLAGENALQRHAYAEAIAHFTTGLALLKTLPDTSERARHELDIQMALGPALVATRSFAAPEVETVYTRARELCQQVGESAQLFPILAGLRLCYTQRAEFQRARALGEEMLSLAQRVQEPVFLTVAHQSLGVVLFDLGELLPARAHLEQGSALYDPRHHQSHASVYGLDPGLVCLSYGAVALWLLGYPAQALQRGHDTLTLGHALAHPFGLVYALSTVAWLHQCRREGQSTQAYAEAAIALAHEHGFPLFVALGTSLRGWALAAQGQAEDGIAQMQQGLAAHRATGSAQILPYIVALMAEAYGHGGQTEAGLTVLAEALALVDKSGERWWEAEMYRLKGELLLQAGVREPESRDLLPHATLQLPHAEAAAACFQQALDIARHQQPKSLELRAAMSLAHLWQRQGKRTEVRELLAPIYGWFTEGFDTADVREAKALLDDLAAYAQETAIFQGRVLPSLPPGF